jgi:hypothetical protein
MANLPANNISNVATPSPVSRTTDETLTSIVTEINACLADIETGMKDCIARAFRAGELLTKAKAGVPHGTFSRHRELIPRVRVLVQARNVFAILVIYGYPYQSHLALLDKGLDEIVRLCRRDLVRGFLTSQVCGEDENECLQFLSPQIENGQWPNWLEEIREIESRLCA